MGGIILSHFSLVRLETSRQIYFQIHFPPQLDESLYAYLLSRNENNEALAIEDGYNLEETCTRFAHEPHISLFTQIIGGGVGEEVFQHWLQIQTTLTEAFSQQELEEVCNCVT